MKIAIINLLPDAGHVISLLRIGSALREAGIECEYFGPRETQHLVGRFSIAAAFFELESGINRSRLMQIYTGTRPFSREVFYNKWFWESFYKKIIVSGFPQEQKLREMVQSFSPDAVMCDSHLFLPSYRRIAKELGVPLIINNAPGNYSNSQDASFHRARDLSPFQQMLAPFVKKTVGKLYSIAKKVFLPGAAKEDAHIEKLVSQYYQNGPTSAHELFISSGTGILEKKYLAGKIQLPNQFFQFGPVSIGADEPIAADLLAWLEQEAAQPVIYVGFGSMVKGEFAAAEKILEAARALGFRVLWSHSISPWGKAEHPGVRWESWVPQSKILSHQNVKLFITHAGAGATQESLWYAKPTISIPFLWDQPYNAWAMKELGCSVVLDKSAITLNTMKQAIGAALALQPQVIQRSNEFKALICTEVLADEVKSFIAKASARIES